MRIESSEIGLSAQHALTEQHTRHEELTVGVRAAGEWEPTTVRTRERAVLPSGPARSSLLDEYVGGLDADLARRIASGGATTGGIDPALLKRAAAFGHGLPAPEVLDQALADLVDGMDLVQQVVSGMLPTSSSSMPAFLAQVPPGEQLKMELIRSAVAAFSGHELTLFDPASMEVAPQDVSATETGTKLMPEFPPEHEPPAAEAAPAPGLVYTYRDTHVERETTQFQARGVVHTADGEQIDIDVSLTMDRSLVREAEGEVRLGGALEDPLVVNFSGSAAELTQRRFAFDLDTDGEQEQIHFVGRGSGFLAYDRNANGVVDDGGELFGPTSGQGFAELAAHDDDGNGFIDEGDSVYSGLRIWEKDEAGNDHLVALGDRGVGAIYLGHIDTPFEVQRADGQLQGVVRSSGIYLREEGGAGTVQQLDLVV